MREHLGEEWVGKLVITADKSLIRGDVLIDDAPRPNARAMTPTWKQIYYSQPYNEVKAGGDGSLAQVRRWADWRAILMAQLGLQLL